MKQPILLVRLSSLGDIVLSSATVLNFKINFPDRRLVFLTKEPYRPLVELFDGVDEVVTVSASASAREMAQVALKLDRYNFELIADLHGNFRSWVLRKVVTANAKLVYPKRRAERLRIVKTHRLPEVVPHTIDLYNDVLERLGKRVVARRPVIPRRSLDPAAHLSSLPKGKPLVVVAPGAAHPTKQWDIERFAEVARLAHQQFDAVIAWVVVSTDAGKVRLGEEMPRGYFFEIVDLPIEQLAAVLSRASMTIANDSGVAHLSSAVGTPVVAVFGPTHPALGFSPRGLWDKVVQVDEPCRPCSLHGKKPCPREQRYCLTRITPEMVFEAVEEIMRATQVWRKALFIDRDGTIIADKHFLSDEEKIEFLPGAGEALREAQRAGFALVVLSNQSGVARGYFDIDTVERVNERFLSLLTMERFDDESSFDSQIFLDFYKLLRVTTSRVEVDGLYYCPHYENGTNPLYAIPCRCRKPAPGMAEEAAEQIGIDLRRSYVIGDKLDDVNLARVLGAPPILVRTGHGKEQERLLEIYGMKDAVMVADDLRSAIAYITARDEKYD